MATSQNNTAVNTGNTNTNTNTNSTQGAPNSQNVSQGASAPTGIGYTTQFDFAAYSLATQRTSGGYPVGLMDLIFNTLANTTPALANAGSAANPLLCKITITAPVIKAIRLQLKDLGRKAPALDLAHWQGTHKLYLSQLVAADFGRQISVQLWANLLKFGQAVPVAGGMFNHIKSSKHTLASVFLSHGAPVVSKKGGLNTYRPAVTNYYTQFFNASALYTNKGAPPANAWQSTATAKKGAGIAHKIAACFTPARQPAHLLVGRGAKKSLVIAYTLAS